MIEGDRQIVEYIREFRLVTVDQLERLTGRQTVWRRLPKILATGEVFCKKRGTSQKYVYSDHPIGRRSELTIEHELLLSDIHIRLSQTGCLAFWSQGKDAWKGEVHQDAFTILEQGERRQHVFVEADTGSENHQQIATKLKIYLEYPDKPFRVLFVTTSWARAQNLARLAGNFIDPKQKKFYLFTSIDRFEPKEETCLIPHDSLMLALLPHAS